MSPETWPSPPPSAMIFESPWVLSIALLIIAVALFFFSGRRRLQQLAIVPVLLAAVVVALSFVVQTDREQMMANTHTLIYSVTKTGDIDTFASLLHDDVKLEDANGHVANADKQSIVTRASGVIQRYGPESHTITNTLVEQVSDTTGVVYVAAFSSLRGPDRQYYPKTTWLMTWRLGADGVWRLGKMQWLTLNGEPADERLLR